MNKNSRNLDEGRVVTLNWFLQGIQVPVAVRKASHDTLTRCPCFRSQVWGRCFFFFHDRLLL